MFSDDGFGEADEPEWPEGVTKEKVEALLEEAAGELKKIGLYAHPVMQLDVQSGQVIAYMAFEVGQLAFSKRVQNPEQDEVDRAFHQFEAQATRERYEEIRKKFIRDENAES